MNNDAASWGSDSFDCETCHLAKQHSKQYNANVYRKLTEPNELLYADLVMVVHGQYILVIVDRFSNVVSVYILKQKSDKMDCLVQYIKWAERQQDKRIKAFSLIRALSS